MFDGVKTFQTIHLDVTKWNKTLEDAIEVQMRQAARAWLREILPRIPVWAGTSRGVFLRVGYYLHVAVPINPVVNIKGLGPAWGLAHSDFEFKKVANSYRFTFSHGVDHLSLNDQYNMRPPFNLKTPGPYKAFEAGERAFLEYLQKNLTKRVRNLREFTVTKELKIG